MGLTRDSLAGGIDRSILISYSGSALFPEHGAENGVQAATLPSKKKY